MRKEPIRVAQIMGKWVGGGVEAVIMNYYRNIDRTKIQFDFICDSDSTNIPYEEIKELGGNVIICPPYQKILKYEKFLINLFKEKQYKIVHSNINTLSVFPLYAAKKAGVPIRIAHSHSVIISSKREFKRTIIKNFLKHFSTLFATDYFACSEMAGISQFGRKKVLDGEVEIINNAIDLDKFKYDEKLRKNKRKELEIKDDTLVIGHIGRFVETKNHKFIIELFNKIHNDNNNSLLLLAGHGPLEKNIKEETKKYGIEDSVKFLGQVNNTNELYQAMDLFILPSFYEGLGMVLIEAQTSGLSCIASTSVPKAAKLVENVCFVDLNKNIDEWIKTIYQFSSNRKDNSMIISKKGYNIKKETIHLMDKYDNLIRKEKKDNKKVKVCHVVSGLRSGGVEAMIYNYCSRMDKAKFDFSILYQHEPANNNVNDFTSIGFKLIRIPNKRKRPIANFIKTYSYFKKNKIDIVHCHMTLMNFFPLLAAKLANVEIRICHSHGSDIRRKRKITVIIENLVKKMCIILSTEQFACGEDAGKYLYLNSNFTVINNALVLSKFAFNPESRSVLRKKFEIKEDEKLILHVGRFEEQKNHIFLINFAENILKSNQNIKFLLIGDGPLKEDIQNLILERNIPNIIFGGIVSNVNEYYSACDLFILPSKYEGLPVSALEAQASGVKCLLSSNIDRKVIVIPDRVKLIDNQIENWVNEILNKNNYSRKENLKKFDESNLNIDIEYKKLENYYLMNKKEK